MKVILLRDIPKIGKKYEVKEISDGYARNFLLPKKLAEPATSARIATLHNAQEKNQQAQETSAQRLKESLVALDGAVVTITTKADANGHLFKKVRAEDIVKALNENNGKDEKEKSLTPFEVSMVELEAPLTTLGSHEVVVQNAHTKATVTVVIEKEKEKQD